jgi:hypothetical protein
MALSVSSVLSVVSCPIHPRYLHVEWAKLVAQASGANPGENLQKAGEISNAHNIRCSGIRTSRFPQAILKVVEMDFRPHLNQRLDHAPLDFPCRTASGGLPEHDWTTSKSREGAAGSA